MSIARKLVGVMIVAAVVLTPVAAVGGGVRITPAVQAELDRQKTAVAEWAAAPVIVAAVREQNRRGPILAMDNARWKTTRRSDPIVKAFQANAAGRFLAGHLEGGRGAYNEAFLSARRGEKVAFVEKTTSYIHAGQAKFDVPYATGKPWQGQPEFDESTQTYAVQVAAPVVDGGTPIGVLVVGVNLSYLETIAKR